MPCPLGLLLPSSLYGPHYVSFGMNNIYVTSENVLYYHKTGWEYRHCITKSLYQIDFFETIFLMMHCSRLVELFKKNWRYLVTTAPAELYLVWLVQSGIV